MQRKQIGQRNRKNKREYNTPSTGGSRQVDQVAAIAQYRYMCSAQQHPR